MTNLGEIIFKEFTGKIFIKHRFDKKYVFLVKLEKKLIFFYLIDGFFLLNTFDFIEFGIATTTNILTNVSLIHIYLTGQLFVYWVGK